MWTIDDATAFRISKLVVGLLGWVLLYRAKDVVAGDPEVEWKPNITPITASDSSFASWSIEALLRLLTHICYSCMGFIIVGGLALSIGKKPVVWYVDGAIKGLSKDKHFKSNLRRLLLDALEHTMTRSLGPSILKASQEPDVCKAASDMFFSEQTQKKLEEVGGMAMGNPRFKQNLVKLFEEMADEDGIKKVVGDALTHAILDNEIRGFVKDVFVKCLEHDRLHLAMINAIKSGFVAAVQDSELSNQGKTLVTDILSDSEIHKAILQGGMGAIKAGILDALRDDELARIFKHILVEALKDEELHSASIKGAWNAFSSNIPLIGRKSEVDSSKSDNNSPKVSNLGGSATSNNTAQEKKHGSTTIISNQDLGPPGGETHIGGTHIGVGIHNMHKSGGGYTQEYHHTGDNPSTLIRIPKQISDPQIGNSTYHFENIRTQNSFENSGRDRHPGDRHVPNIETTSSNSSPYMGTNLTASNYYRDGIMSSPSSIEHSPQTLQQQIAGRVVVESDSRNHEGNQNHFSQFFSQGLNFTQGTQGVSEGVSQLFGGGSVSQLFGINGNINLNGNQNNMEEDRENREDRPP